MYIERDACKRVRDHRNCLVISRAVPLPTRLHGTGRRGTVRQGCGPPRCWVVGLDLDFSIDATLRQVAPPLGLKPCRLEP